MRSRFLTGLWANPDFVRLWAGTTTSTFGTLIGGLAMSFTAIVYLDATAPEVAFLGACQLVPGFLASPFAGVWVDRLKRRPILVITDLARAATLVSVPVAAVFGVLTMWQLYAVAALISGLSVLFDAAYRSYLPTVVARRDLLEGNAKLAGTASIVETVSFSISGWLVQLLKAPGALGVNAATYLASALFISRIEQPEAEVVAEDGETSFWREAKDGARVVLADGVLRTLALAEALQSMAERVLVTVYLLYLNGELGFSPGVLGMIFAVGGVTSLFGAWLANRGVLFFGGIGPTLIVSSFLRASGALFMPLCFDNGWISVAFLVASQLVTDPFWALFEIHDTSLRQSITPERTLGRMFANFRLIGFGFALVGTAIGGVLGSLIGFRETLFVAVGIMYVGVAVLALSPVLRLRQPGLTAA